jgi:catechol 2,3-dioxygenase-like lactoylglutathione lyase family enzyme
MKLRTQDPWMTGVDYSRGLHGFTVNLLVADIGRAVEFARRVLGATVVFSDPDFAAVRYGEQEWMLHADHTYDRHPHGSRTLEASFRGAGVELRIHDADVDAAVQAAGALGCTVLSEPQQKGHGMREAYILDLDGYTWVVDAFVGPPAG